MTYAKPYFFETKILYHTNTVRLILIVAGKGSTPGQKSTADDRADAASRANKIC